VGQLGSAAAQTTPASTSARLEVEANPTCTSRSDLIARIRARSPRVSFSDDERAIAIRAQFSAASAGGIAGDVTLATPGAKPAQRRVLARSCNEAADAVALIIAVTLDPASLEHVQPEPSGTAAARSGPNRERAPATGEGAAATVASSDAPRTAESPPQSARLENPTTVSDVTSPDASGGGRPRLGAQLAFQTVVGPAPRLMPGAALYLELGLERAGVWAPSALWGATHVASPEIVRPGGVASFSLDAVSFDACPLRLRIARLTARPCVSALAGRLSAQGSETRNPAGVMRRPFWIVGGSGILSTGLLSLLEASFRVSVGANLVRDSFTFTPEVFHEVSAMSAAASLGLGLRLP
jgi:hypothetical protein